MTSPPTDPAYISGGGDDDKERHVGKRHMKGDASGDWRASVAYDDGSRRHEVNENDGDEDGNDNDRDHRYRSRGPDDAYYTRREDTRRRRSHDDYDDNRRLENSGGSGRQEQWWEKYRKRRRYDGGGRYQFDDRGAKRFPRGNDNDRRYPAAARDVGDYEARSSRWREGGSTNYNTGADASSEFNHGGRQHEQYRRRSGNVHSEFARHDDYRKEDYRRDETTHTRVPPREDFREPRGREDGFHGGSRKEDLGHRDDHRRGDDYYTSQRRREQDETSLKRKEEDEIARKIAPAFSRYRESSLERTRRREVERDYRLERADVKNRKHRRLDEDRDVSEKIALGQAQATAQESLYDARLFNRDSPVAGPNITVADDDDYVIYDKPLFEPRNIRRPL